MTYFALTLIIDATQGNGSSFAKLSSFKGKLGLKTIYLEAAFSDI